MLEDVAVIHPLARSVVRAKCDRDPALGDNVDGVFPRRRRCRYAIDRDDLEEEAVKVKRMVQPGLVDDVPDLERRGDASRR
jgi:hypothetical protein